MSWVALVISHQSSGLDQPAKGSFHDPAPGKKDEAFGGITALDDREDQSAGVPKERACRAEEAFEFARVAVLHARRGDDHAQSQPQSFGKDVTFTALDLSDRVVAATPCGHGVGALQALAVDDRGSGSGVFLPRCAASRAVRC